MKYETSNLWVEFGRDCPIISRIPLIGLWGFGVYVRAYFQHKRPMQPEAFCVREEMLGGVPHWMIYRGERFFERWNTPESAAARMAELL